MNREEKIEKLKELRDCSLHYESYEVKEDDAEALIWAINELERTAQEVPVQEQYVTLEVINKELNISLSQKQYEEIAILDICTPKYTAYEILKLLKTLSVI